MFGRVWNRILSCFQHDNDITIASGRINRHTIIFDHGTPTTVRTIRRSLESQNFYDPTINPATREPLPRGVFYRRRPNVNVGTIGHAEERFITTTFGPIRSDETLDGTSLRLETAPVSKLSKDLQTFMSARRIAENLNENLSQKFNASDQYLFCPILQNFPQIPVRFNGRLYDYDSLIQLEQGGFISDPYTREKVQLAAHIIQPDYDAQKRMDELHLEMRQAISNRR